MIGASETQLTLGGFIALASLGIAGLGLALNTASKSGETRERLTKLETKLEDHLTNGGTRHERKDQDGPR
jgi:hypothetical protein